MENEDEASLAALINRMPFAFQARCRQLGDRFQTRVRELRAEGLSDKAIATALGVNASAVNHLRQKLGIG